MTGALDKERARKIRLVVVDVDGVLTDNGVYVGMTASGEEVELKRFHIQDGLGLKFLQWTGVEVLLLSGRVSPATSMRAEELGVEAVQHGGARKVPALAAILERRAIEWSEVAMVADDLADLPVLRRVGLPVAVANAVPEVKAEAALTTERPGGAGAVRELAEAILRARGVWEAAVEAYCQSLTEEDSSIEENLARVAREHREER